MSMKQIRNSERYQIRYAAGQYWLLDMEQPGVPYRRPMCMNELGAEIWKRLADGWNEEEIAEVLIREYDVSKEEILEDVIQFKISLQTYGIEFEEQKE